MNSGSRHDKEGVPDTSVTQRRWSEGMLRAEARAERFSCSAPSERGKSFDGSKGCVRAAGWEVWVAQYSPRRLFCSRRLVREASVVQVVVWWRRWVKVSANWRRRERNADFVFRRRPWCLWSRKVRQSVCLF
jgi:hypothetical protein